MTLLALPAGDAFASQEHPQRMAADLELTGAYPAARSSSFETSPLGRATLGPAASPDLGETGAKLPAFVLDMLAQRVLDDDEKRPSENEEPERLERKNPWIAMGLSAILPGAGQFYLDRSNPLAFAYVGVEALAIYLHYQWESDGDEKTREFEEYAFQGFLTAEADSLHGYRPEMTGGHWDWQRWRDSFAEAPEGCISVVEAGHEGIAVDEQLIDFWFTNRREFYEDIGKYDKYDCGWRADHRDIYRSMRNETNDILQRARLMTQVVLLNHITSSIHAFFLTRSHNNRVDELEREASLRQLRWRFSPDRNFDGLKAELWLTQRF